MTRSGTVTVDVSLPEYHLAITSFTVTPEGQAVRVRALLEITDGPQPGPFGGVPMMLHVTKPDSTTYDVNLGSTGKGAVDVQGWINTVVPMPSYGVFSFEAEVFTFSTVFATYLGCDD